MIIKTEFVENHNSLLIKNENFCPIFTQFFEKNRVNIKKSIKLIKHFLKSMDEII